MKLSFRIPLIAAAALALGACGGSDNGAHLTTKEEAANALMSSNQAYGNGQEQALVYKAAQSALGSGSGSASLTVNCRNGNGSVTADASVSGTDTGSGGSLSATVKLSYSGCEAGDYVDANGTKAAVIVDGEIDWALAFDSTTSSFSGNVTMDGELDFSGGITDKVVAEGFIVDVSATSGAAGAQVSVNVQGKLTTNEGSFTFAQGDTVTFTGGSFSGTAQVSGNG